MSCCGSSVFGDNCCVWIIIAIILLLLCGEGSGFGNIFDDNCICIIALIVLAFCVCGGTGSDCC